MFIVYAIMLLFLVSWLIAGLSGYSWHRANQSTKKERLMSRKAKFSGNKSRVKEVLHLDYLRVYHEVLKYEEIMDIDLDTIFNAVVAILQRKLAKDKLAELPDSIDIEILIKEVMDKLTGSTK